MTINDILYKPHLLQFIFKFEKERRAIRLLFTLALIEDILNHG